jgi:hypothetical protein
MELYWLWETEEFGGVGGIFQWHFVHSKSPSDYPGIEPEALRYEAGV